MDPFVLVDIGSTFTKVAAVDLDDHKLIGVSSAPSSVETDVVDGISHALTDLERQSGHRLHGAPVRACSSAAGGLRMVVVGLVPELTVEAARLAALGAGANVVGVYGYRLSESDVAAIERTNPDIILLVGGTDGGNRTIIEANASALATLDTRSPILVAGNKCAISAVLETLAASGKTVRAVDNVLTTLKTLCVEPCRQAIQDLFLEHIVKAKGIDRVQGLSGRVVMPTPLAVAKATQLLADGTAHQPGWSEVVTVDVGGATTDVHSVAEGAPTQQVLSWRGIAEPRTKRTVEGDSGIRYNAASLVNIVGMNAVLERAGLPDGDSAPRAQKVVESWHAQSPSPPQDDFERRLERGLACHAIRIAATRHAGYHDVVWTPTGQELVQWGKDLTQVPYLVGVGGIFVHAHQPKALLREALYREANPTRLLPTKPELLIDHNYIMYAMGLLGEQYPDLALRLLKQSLGIE